MDILGDCLDKRGIGFYSYVPLINELAFGLPQVEFVEEPVIKVARQLIEKEMDQMDFQTAVDKSKMRYLEKADFMKSIKAVIGMADKDIEVLFL